MATNGGIVNQTTSCNSNTKTVNPLPEQVNAEFENSAIAPALVAANVVYLSGREALVVFNPPDFTSPGKDFGRGRDDWRKWAKSEQGQAIAAGGWLTWGTTIDGGVGEVPYFKPSTPRIDFEKHKPIKYETPVKCEGLPLLPFVDDETAQAIYDRYELKPQAGETFWQVVRRCNVPIAVAEGLKKALALIAHGIPAIAIRGIAMWRKKGTNALHDVVADFATGGRVIYIVFDQDSKAATVRAVRRETGKLAAALEKGGAKPHIPSWDGAIGKGVDDCLFAQGDAAQAWLDGVIESAPSIDVWRKGQRVQSALDNLQRLGQLSYPVERATAGEYLPKLPELQRGAIHVLSAAMNAGKTTRIGGDWKHSAIADGWNVLVLVPINNLGRQAAADWDLPHIHDYGTDRDSQYALWSEVSAKHGIVMCADSLHRIPAEFWLRPTLLILDEANQVIESLTGGDTLGSRYSDILERFAAATKHAISSGAIVLSEDGIPDRTVNFVDAISGGMVRVFTHQKQAKPWDCTVYRGNASGYRAAFLRAVLSGKRVIYVASSQREAKRIDRAIARLAPDRKVVRIDSETNEGGAFTAFFEQPEQWLHDEQPDVLILSPSAKSGVSIEGGVSVEDAYFQAVWGYFPVLGTDTHIQQLGRYRPPVPRIIFCPDFILSSGDESLLSPRAIRRRLGLNAKAIAGVYSVGELLTVEGDEQAELMAAIQSAVLNYVACAKAAIGNQKAIAHIALCERLKGAGHTVTSATAEKDKSIVELWKAINEGIWRDEAAQIATAQIEQNHDLAWARAALDSLDASRETRTIAHKILWRHEFPGVTFNCPEECYQALTRDYGAMRRGVLLQAKAENLEGAQADDREIVQAILSGNIKALHRLPSSYVRALMIAQSGVLELLDGSQYTAHDPRCQRVKAWAIRFASEVRYWLRLTINETQSPIEICHKLLKKFGLERDKADRVGAIKTIGRFGKRGQNSEVFRVDMEFCPIRTKLLNAVRERLSASVTSTCNKEDSLLQVDVTPPQNPPKWPKSGHFNPHDRGTDPGPGYTWDDWDGWVAESPQKIAS